jgi:hypothetical protein
VKILTLARNSAFVAILALVAVHSTAFAATNLVTNPGFETGDFTGWTQSGNATFFGVTADARRSGSFGGRFGPVGNELGFLSQTLATTPGETYQLDYWLRNLSSSNNEFQVSWNGTILTSLTDANAFDFTLFTFSGLAATGTSTTLSFGFSNPPSFWHLDDVSVVATGTPPVSNGVPDAGSSAFLMVLGLAALVGVRRRVR